MDPFITCQNLVKIYKVAGLEVVALQGLDLTVEPGELLGIVGASGSGKSTLLNILGGLDRPSAGRVSVGERDLLKLSDQALDAYRRREVGFVWQQTARNLIPYLSAEENVALPMTIAGMGLRQKRQWTEELLRAVGLWEHRKHQLAQLSGGQQQRVAIAVALANKPLLLLGDEPTGEVDSATAREIMALLKRLNRQYGLTTVIVTHDPETAGAVDRVVTIRDGRTSSEAIRRAEEVAAALTAEVEAEGATDETAVYEEYVVVDATGRLQIPPDLRRQMGIGGRVTLEATEDGVLIRPVAAENGDEIAETAVVDMKITNENESSLSRSRRLLRWLRRHSRRSGQEDA